MQSGSDALAKQASPDEVKKTVIETLSRYLPNGTEGLSDNAEFDELGLDSLSGVEASRALAAALGPLGITGIKPTFLFEASCVRSVFTKAMESMSVVKTFTEKMPQTQMGNQLALQVDFHSVGEVSGSTRMLMAAVATSLAWFLRLLGWLPFLGLLLGLMRPQEMVSGLDTALLFYMLFILATVMQFYLALLTLWVAKNLFLGRVKEGLWPTWGWKMACLKGIRSYEESVFQSLFVRCFERTEIPNIIWRLLGTQVGRGAYISQSDDPPLMAWDMMSIGENAILDGTNVLDASRTFHMNQRLSIGNDAVICANAIIKGGATVGDGAVVLPNTTLAGALGSREVYDGGVGSTGHLRAHDLEAERCLSLPRRTPLGLAASLVVFPFLCWLRVLSMWPFIVDIAFLAGRYLPLVLGGRQPSEGDVSSTLLLFPAICVLSTLIYELLVVGAAVAAKWMLLGRLREGRRDVGNLFLFRFEICFNLTTHAAQVMRSTAQTVANNAFIKAMGGNVSWSWMPSPLNAAAYLSADLVTIEPDAFTASKTMLNCIMLSPSDGKLPGVSPVASGWQLCCHRIHLGARSFVGPMTMVTPGAALGEGSATMDQTFVPPGMLVPSWRTLMGTSVDGRFMVKRKQDERLPHGAFPYALSVFLNSLAGRVVRLWLNFAIPAVSMVAIRWHWGTAIAPSLGMLLVSDTTSLSAAKLSTDLEQLLTFSLQWVGLMLILDTIGHSLLFVLSKHLVLGRVTESSGGQLRGWGNLRWVSTVTITAFSMLSVKLFTHTPLMCWLAKAAGARVGKGCYINYRALLTCPEQDMITLGDNVFIGGAFYAHEFGASNLVFKAVKVGDGAHTGGRAVLTPGSRVPAGAISLEGALVIPGSTDPKSEKKQYLSGNPAVAETTPFDGLLEVNGRHL